MDAISFVLGVKSSQLRSAQLKDLIHRPPKTTTADQEDDQDDDEEEELDENTELKKAWVMAVYEKSDGKELKFMRTCVLLVFLVISLTSIQTTHSFYN